MCVSSHCPSSWMGEGGVGPGGSAHSQSCHRITTGAPARCRRDRITPAWGAGVATWLSPAQGTTHDKSLFTIPPIRDGERSVIQTHIAFPDHPGRCWDLPFRLFPSLLHTTTHGSVSPGYSSLLFLLPCPQRHQSQGPGPLTKHLAGSTHLPVLGLAVWRLQGVRVSSGCLDCTGFYPVNSLQVRCRWND